MRTRRYSELICIPTLEERFQYLKLDGAIGETTFGFERYLNQALYRSPEWKRIRNQIIVRDNGCDMAVEGFPVDRPIIHHMNPITSGDIEQRAAHIFNPEFLVCVSFRTHNAIHFGDEDQLPKLPVERKPGDTCPWR